MSAWWLMHGYAAYVWPAYGLVVVVFVLNVWRARARAKQIRRLLALWWADQ